MIKNRKLKLFKALKLTFSVAWWCILALLLILLVNIFGAKLQGKVPTVFGYSVMNIVSGSMGDTIPQGSYILIKSKDPEEVRRDEIICFYSTDPKIYGMPNTHRVVEDPIVTEEGIEFVTRGDANLMDDKQRAKGDRLIGVYVKTLDELTAFSKFLQGNTLIIVMIALQICTISMFCYVAVVVKRGKNTENGDNNDSQNDSQKQ